MSNAAESLVQTLSAEGVDTCFSSHHTARSCLDSAFLTSRDFRVIATSFEGVASGAADGYGRMTGKPAVMISHHAAGFGNSQANLHNARKAKTPIINLVGDSSIEDAFTVKAAMRESNIETAVRNISSWVRTSSSADELARDAAESLSVATGYPTQIPTLIVPEDIASGTSRNGPSVMLFEEAVSINSNALENSIEALATGDTCAILIGGRALQEPTLGLVAKIAAKAGVRLLSEVFPARMRRGRGAPKVERLAYLADMADVQLRGLKHLVLVDTKAPVSFFAYPGKAGCLVPKGCAVHELVTPDHDIDAVLKQVCEMIGAMASKPILQEPVEIRLPKGKLTGDKACDVIAALLPENAIVSDESQTSGAKFMAKSAGSPAHDLLTLTGGAIGQGFPVAVGAAVACPDRPVVAMTGDGSAMYTIQSLATMAQEQLDVTAIVFNNVSYSILNIELERVGFKGSAGPKAKSQLDLSGPALDFVEIGTGMGLTSVRVDSCESFAEAFSHALEEGGPHLIEVMVPPSIAGFKLKVLPRLLNSLRYLPTPLARALKNWVAP